jgi:hypothetical protein
MTAKSELVEVTVETLLGARYVFPDMPRSTLTDGFLKANASVGGKLSLANVSGAFLSLPSRIVRSISFDGEVRWENAAVRELQKADGPQGS